MRTYRPQLALSLLGTLLLTITACTPAAGRPVEQFIGVPQDVIAEIAAYGVSLQPENQMNFFSIESIGDRFVTLSSESTTGYSILFGSQTTKLTFSATQQGDLTLLASSGQGSNAKDMLDKIILHLHSVFETPPPA